MNLKNLERRIHKLAKPPLPTATLYFKDGHSETIDWVVGLDRARAEADLIESVTDSHGGFINSFLHPLPNRNIHDYE